VEAPRRPSFGQLGRTDSEYWRGMGASPWRGVSAGRDQQRGRMDGLHADRVAPPQRKKMQDSPASEDVVLADMRQRLRTVLDFELIQYERIVTALNNNRLFRLQAADGLRVVVKLYYRDDRRRLEREYGILRFLQERHVSRVPTPLLRCDQHNYAIYSHEPGVTKRSADLTTAEVTNIARFAVDLHRIRPGDPGADFPPVAVGCFSVAEKVAAIRERLAPWMQFATGMDASPAVRELYADIDVGTVFDALLATVTAGLSAAERTATTPPEDRRLDSGDFAPHNVLVRPDGGVCVLDFENAGWDQPLALTACFLTAATALDLGGDQVTAFLRTYRAAIPLSNEDVIRFERLCALQHLYWCAIHLSLTTPAQLTRKRFANPDLDAEAVTMDQIRHFRHRLALSEAAVAGAPWRSDNRTEGETDQTPSSGNRVPRDGERAYGEVREWR